MSGNREHLARLPAELLLMVAEDLCLSTRDLAAFARASPRYTDLVISALYKKNIREEHASACKTFWFNQHDACYPLAWCATTDTEASAVLWAVLNENTGTMALLIRYGADINSVEASTRLYKSTPYRWIKRLRRWDSHAEGDGQRKTRSRLSYGNFGYIPNIMPTATQFGFQPGALPLLPNATLPPARQWRQPDITREFRFAPLALAARKGLTTAAKWLLENGADPEVPARDLCRCDNDPMMSSGMWHVPHHATGPVNEQPHWTALHLAIHHGHDDIVELLVAHGANARQVCRPKDGPCSALHTAFIHMRVSIVESLMYRYEGTDMVDINAQGRGGITPLHIAYCVQGTQGPLVDLALKFGAYVNLEYEIDQNQWTLFAMACTRREDWNFALRLLKLGANPEFDLERQFGGRWTLDDFRRDIMRIDPYTLINWDAGPLVQELDQVARDHEVAMM